MPDHERTGVSTSKQNQLQLVGWRKSHAASSNGNDARRDLARPLGSINWFTIVPTLLCAAIMFLFLIRLIDLAAISINWTIVFDTNLALALGSAGTGLVATISSILRDRQALRSRKTLISITLTASCVALFMTRIVDLGTFSYKQSFLDVNSLIVLALTTGVAVFALKGSRIAVLVLAIAVMSWALNIEGFGLNTFTDLFTSEDGARLLRNLTPPTWSYINVALDPLLLTIRIAIVSTILGIVGALPLSIVAARNTTPYSLLYILVRSVMNIVRAVPALLLALLLIPFVGLGPGAGVLGLGIHAISVLTKIFAETIESVSPAPLEALDAVGASGLKRFRWGVVPQALPGLASYSLYAFELNVRDSTVVAFVGGGGIGFLLQENINLLAYHNVAVLLAMLIVAVIILDRASDFLRSKIL